MPGPRKCAYRKNSTNSKHIAGTDARLSNEAFVSKAPPAVLDGARKQLADQKAKRGELERLLKSLGVNPGARASRRQPLPDRLYAVATVRARKTFVARWGNRFALRIPRDLTAKSRLTAGVGASQQPRLIVLSCAGARRTSLCPSSRRRASRGDRDGTSVGPKGVVSWRIAWATTAIGRTRKDYPPTRRSGGARCG